MNKELRDFSEAVFFGLSMRQSVFSALAVGAALGIYFLFRDSISTKILGFMCIAGALPFALGGFFRYQGMSLEQFIAAWARHEALPQQIGRAHV